MKKLYLLIITCFPLVSWAQLHTPSTPGTTTGNNNVGIITSDAQVQLTVGSTFGAHISGSSGGHGVFGSNFAVYQGGGNHNQLYTPYAHASYGYSGLKTSWGQIDFYAASGATTAGQVITPVPVASIRQNGRMGIGELTPEARLHIRDGGQSVKFLTGANTSAYALSIGLNDDGINFSSDSEIRGFNFSNTRQSIRFLTGSNTSGYALNIGVNDDGVNFSNNSSIRGFNFNNANGSLVCIKENGNVGIGTITPGSFKLAVNGKIWTQEVNVAMTNPGPDYVFEKDYDLLPLSELETYIARNKHLPEVPSAKEMEKDGLNLKEMNLLLLRKIEELTLHLIEQNKEIAKLKERSVSPDPSGKKVEELTLHLIETNRKVGLLQQEVNNLKN